MAFTEARELLWYQPRCPSRSASQPTSVLLWLLWWPCLGRFGTFGMEGLSGYRPAGWILRLLTLALLLAPPLLSDWPQEKASPWAPAVWTDLFQLPPLLPHSELCLLKPWPSINLSSSGCFCQCFITVMWKVTSQSLPSVEQGRAVFNGLFLGVGYFSPCAHYGKTWHHDSILGMCILPVAF